MDHGHMRHLHGKGHRSRFDIALEDKREIADGTWLFVFEKPLHFRYRAGQHVRMRLKGGYRFWSFASSPFQSDLAFAVRMRGTPPKRALTRLPVGATVGIEMMPDPPPGAFGLDERETRPAVFLCGGIGVAPAVSIIRQALHMGSPRPFVLVYASHRPSAAPFLHELQALAADHANFTFVPTMTRLEPEDAWNGERRRINRALLECHVPDLADAAVYVAGRKDMVRDMRALLRNAGIADTAIHAEDFGDFAPRRNSSVLPMAATAMLLLLAVALHGLPLALWVRRDTSPMVLGAAGAIALAIAVKCLWLLWRSHKARQ